MDAKSTFMRCGAGRADITPPVGTPMGGFANRLMPCQGARDRLSARALFLHTADASALIITLDALAVNPARTQQLRDIAVRVGGVAGVQADHIQITCSHTHSGVDLAGLRLRADIARINRINDYFDHVCAAVRDAVGAACADTAPATLGLGTMPFVIGRNRRLRPGHANVTDLERSQGENIDQALTVLRFTHAERSTPIATLFQIACHPVCLGPENVFASGDFAGIAAQLVEAHTGAPALFLNGAAGNVTPLIGRGSSYDATRGLAQTLADAVYAIDLHPEPAELRCSSPTVAQLPLSCRFTNDDDIDRQAMWLLGQKTEFPSWPSVVAGWQSRMRSQLAAGQLPATIDIPLSATRIGGTTFVFAGAELFNEYQLWQPPNARLVSYANGECCYVPTSAALASGGYEVTTSPVFYGLPCAPGEDAELVLLDAIHRASRL